MQEPPPVKQVKPLPKPDDAPRKKRGGRRCVLLVNAYWQFNKVLHFKPAACTCPVAIPWLLLSAKVACIICVVCPPLRLLITKLL